MLHTQMDPRLKSVFLTALNKPISQLTCRDVVACGSALARIKCPGKCGLPAGSKEIILEQLKNEKFDIEKIKWIVSELLNSSKERIIRLQLLFCIGSYDVLYSDI